MSFPVSLVGGIPGQFLECSFRGVPFAVTRGSGTNGRRTSTHEYVGRDGVFVEDLGKRGRSFRVSGFMLGVLSYTQRDLLVRACEQKGPGILVHPSLGVLNVVVTDPLQWTEREGVINVIDIEIGFTEQTQLLKSVVTTSSHAAMGVVSKATGQIAASGYINDVNPLYSTTGSVIGGASAAAATWSAPLMLFSKSPAIVSNMDKENLSAFRTVMNTASNEIALASNPSDLSNAMQNLLSVFSNSSLPPKQQISQFMKLSVPPSEKGNALQNMTSSVGNIFALSAMAQSIVTWTASSALDALKMREKVENIFDTLIFQNLDWGGLFENLVQLKSLCMDYLLNQASQLPDMIEIEAPTILPCLSLAQALYGDGSRADELFKENTSVIHPAFMPKKFIAKSV